MPQTAESGCGFREPTGLFWAGAGVGICDMGATHVSRLGGQAARRNPSNQAMISPASSKVRPRLSSWLEGEEAGRGVRLSG